jgi:NodT family efflux transporter outer membrane factor (OMF) lipoprotein
LKCLFLLLLAAMTIGCQPKPIEIRHKPELEISEQWSSPGIDDGRILSQWWESFQDPVLSQLLKKGLENNHNLQAAAARVEAASAQARIAGASLVPSVSAGWSAMGQRQNFIGFPIPGAEDQVLSRTFKSSGVSLDASWEPDVWGRMAAGKVAALADLEATQADLRAAKLSLVAQISKAWFAILEGWEQVQLAQDTVESYRDTSKQVRSRYIRGLQSSLDLRLARSNLSSAEALLKQRRQQLDAGIRQLEILLGDYPSAQLQTEHRLPDVPSPPPTGIPSELVSRRPDLIAAEQRMWAAGARWTQARKALYPSFNLTGRTGTSTSDFLQVFNGNFFTWSLSGSVLQPVFEGGRLRAQVQLEDARSKEAAAQWAWSVLKALYEVESALAAEKLLREQEEHIRDASQQAAASRQLAEDRYGSGLESIITVLEAQRRSLDAESQRLSIHRQRLDTRVELHLALGGGFGKQPTEADARDLEGKDSSP